MEYISSSTFIPITSLFRYTDTLLQLQLMLLFWYIIRVYTAFTPTLSYTVAHHMVSHWPCPSRKVSQLQHINIEYTWKIVQYTAHSPLIYIYCIYTYSICWKKIANVSVPYELPLWHSIYARPPPLRHCPPVVSVWHDGCHLIACVKCIEKVYLRGNCRAIGAWQRRLCDF